MNNSINDEEYLWRRIKKTLLMIALKSKYKKNNTWKENLKKNSFFLSEIKWKKNGEKNQITD